jgi:hypothetical protein
MTKVEVEAGSCGFKVIIEVIRVSAHGVKANIPPNRRHLMIVIIETPDTKGDKTAYLKRVIESKEAEMFDIDWGVLDEPLFTADISQDISFGVLIQTLRLAKLFTEREKQLDILTQALRVGSELPLCLLQTNIQPSAAQRSGHHSTDCRANCELFSHLKGSVKEIYTTWYGARNSDETLGIAFPITN